MTDTTEEIIEKMLNAYEIYTLEAPENEDDDYWIKKFKSDILKIIELTEQREKEKVKKTIDEWAKDNFYWNNQTEEYEVDGLTIHIEDLKNKLEIK